MNILVAKKTAQGVGLAALLGLAGLASTTTSASASYTTTRCGGGYCHVVRCDNDGDNCYTVRSYDRDDYYYRSGYQGGRRWVCEADGDDCRWVYDRDYRYREYRPHFGIGFGF